MNDQVKNIHKRAISYYKEKKFTEAIQLWRKALELNPQEIEVLYSLGLIYFELKKYDDAIKFLNQLLELSPGHDKAMLIIGISYIKLRKFDIAEDYIQKSLDINPKNKLAFLNLGAIYSIQKKFDKGIEMFQRVIELYPNEIRGYFGLGKIYALLGQTEDANHYFKYVIDLDKKGTLGNYAKKSIVLNENSQKNVQDLEQNYANGYRYFIGGYYYEAIKSFELCLSSRSNDDLVNFLLAECQIRCGMLNKSFLSFKKAIMNNPKKGLYYKELAILIDSLGNPKDVIDIIAKAEELGIDDSLIKYLKGKNLHRLERINEAIDELENSIKLDRNNLAARIELAKIYIHLNEKEKAKTHLNFILDCPVESPLKTFAEKLMIKLR